MVDKALDGKQSQQLMADQQQQLPLSHQEKLLRQQQYAEMLIAANQGEYDFEDDFSDGEDDGMDPQRHPQMTPEQERLLQMQMQEQLYLEHQQMLEQMTEEEILAFQAQFKGMSEIDPSTSASVIEQQRQMMNLDQLQQADAHAQAAALLQQQHSQQNNLLMQHSHQIDNLNDYIDEMQHSQQIQPKNPKDAGIIEGAPMANVTWIQWLCCLEGHEFLVPINHDFLRDSFNSICVDNELALPKSRIKECMRLLQSNQMPSEKELQSEVFLQLNQDASDLYGVIHARYLRSKEGLAIIYNRYLQSFYGTCPRSLCDRQSVIPTGMSDKFKTSRVKIFCPKCEEVYIPKMKNNTLDGAYFGSSLPMIFLQSYPSAVVLPPVVQQYEPKIYGFKIAAKRGSKYEKSFSGGIKYTEDEEDVGKLIEQFKKTSLTNGSKSCEQSAHQQSASQKSQRKKKSAPANKK